MFIWSRGRLLSAVAALPLACAGPVAPPGAVADASFADASFADASFADASFAEVATTDAVTPPDDGASPRDAGPGLDAPARDVAAATDVLDVSVARDVPVDVPVDAPSAPDARDVALADAGACAVFASSSALGAGVFTGTTVGATHRPRASACPQAGPELTLAWTAPSTGYFRFDTASSRFDTVLSVARSCGGEELACNDDGVGIRSSLTVQARAGETLYVTLDGALGASSGSFVVDVTAAAGPQCEAAGYTCAADLSGWDLGYVRDAAEPCAAPFVDSPAELFVASDLAPGALTCDCVCGPPSGACVAELDCDSGAACVPGGTRTIGASCGPNLGFGRDLTYACTLARPTPAGTGSCASSHRESARARPTWTPRARFCAAPSGSPCASSATSCRPRIPAGRATCVLQRGSRSCPAPYTRRTVYKGGLFTDTRSCGAGTCGCAPARITDCACEPDRGCRAGFYTSDLCGTDSRVAGAVVGSCSSFRYLGIRDARPQLEGTTAVLDPCATTGAAAQGGSVYPVEGNDITVCCKPEG